MRDQKLIIACGGKGIGKTFRTCKMIEDYLTVKYNSDGSIKKHARKVLIVDSQGGEYANDVLATKGHRFRTKLLAKENLVQWVRQSKVEVRRMVFMDAHGRPISGEEQEAMLKFILENFKGGLLVLEDISKFMTDTSSNKIFPLIISLRHLDVDCIIHLQSLSPVSPKMWQNINTLRLHHQSDDTSRYKGRIPNYEMVKIGEIMVDTEYYKQTEEGKRFHLWLDIDYDKIHGNFTTEMFEHACREYLQMYDPSLIRQEERRYKGEKDSYEKAVRAMINYLSMYDGRKKAA